MSGTKITLLHISDLHERVVTPTTTEERRKLIVRQQAARQRVVGEPFDRIIDKVLQDGPIDFICFTGDLADWGLSQEYARAGERLDSWLRRLALPRTRLIAIPGNHDVARHIAKPAWEKISGLTEAELDVVSDWMSGGEPPRDVPAQLADDILERTSNFRTWLNDFRGDRELDPRSNRHGRLGFRYSPPDYPIHFLGLDSAWLAGKKDEIGALALTNGQLDLLCTGDEGAPLPDIRIALVHHPLSCLRDERAVLQRLPERVDLLLHGHQHHPLATRLQNPDRSLHVVAAGSIYEGDRTDQWINGFQRVDLELTDQQLQVDVRFYAWSEQGFWHPASGIYEAAADGRLSMQIDRRSANKSKPATRPSAPPAPSVDRPTRPPRNCPSWKPRLPADAAAPETWNIDVFFAFLSHILVHEDGRSVQLAEILDAVSSLQPSSIVTIRGAQGSGKSTLLAIIAEAMRRRAEDRNRPACKFVNLATYRDQRLGGDVPGVVVESLVDDFKALRLEIEASRQEYILVVDGITIDNEFVESCFLQLQALQQTVRIRGMVLAVRDSYEAVFTRKLKDLGYPMPAQRYGLATMRFHGEPSIGLLQEFINFASHLRGGSARATHADARQLMNRAKNLAFEPIDTHLLSKIFSKLHDKNYGQSWDIVEFLELYCSEQLTGTAALPANENELRRAACHAFREINGCADQSPLEASDAARKLVREHSNFRDFLAAWYIVDVLRRARLDDEARNALLRRDFLQIDLPETVNRFVKKLLTRNDETLRSVFATAREVHERAQPETRLFLYYVLGRVDRRATIASVKPFLAKVRDNLSVQNNAQESESQRTYRRAFFRTASISLIYLGDKPSLDQYIRHLIENHEAASINRGFHRIYYGDAQPNLALGGTRFRDDSNADWTQTREVLYSRIQHRLTAGDHLSDDDVLFEIRLFTLISFHQNRGIQHLSSEQVVRLRQVISQAIVKTESIELRSFANSFLIDLDRCSFSPWDLIIDFFGLKSLPRQGWLLRGIPVFNEPVAESVAEHSYLACLIAWFLLPESLDPPNPKYSKSLVIEMLLMHDIAEAFIGDQVVVSMDEKQRSQHRERERIAMEYIRMKSSSPGIQGATRAFERWSAFEERGGSDQDRDINERLAHDIDRLENLVQLWMYRKALQPSDVDEFRADLIGRIQTPIGKKLVEQLSTWTEQRTKVELRSATIPPGPTPR